LSRRPCAAGTRRSCAGLTFPVSLDASFALKHLLNVHAMVMDTDNTASIS
jgi:hypothetical protein